MWRRGGLLGLVCWQADGLRCSLPPVRFSLFPSPFGCRQEPRASVKVYGSRSRQCVEILICRDIITGPFEGIKDYIQTDCDIDVRWLYTRGMIFGLLSTPQRRLIFAPVQWRQTTCGNMTQYSRCGLQKP